jgi:hypothetical protein
MPAIKFDQDPILVVRKLRDDWNASCSRQGVVIETCVIVEQVGVLRAVNKQESEPNRFDFIAQLELDRPATSGSVSWRYPTVRCGSKDTISGQLS